MPCAMTLQGPTWGFWDIWWKQSRQPFIRSLGNCPACHALCMRPSTQEYRPVNMESSQIRSRGARQGPTFFKVLWRQAKSPLRWHTIGYPNCITARHLIGSTIKKWTTRNCLSSTGVFTEQTIIRTRNHLPPQHTLYGNSLQIIYY